jgi:hypothetical protein
VVQASDLLLSSFEGLEQIWGRCYQVLVGVHFPVAMHGGAAGVTDVMDLAVGMELRDNKTGVTRPWSRGMLLHFFPCGFFSDSSCPKASHSPPAALVIP